MAAPELQIIVVFSTIFISAATFLLARKLMLEYKKKKMISYIFWGMGLWLFGLAALLEAEFALNIYSEPLIAVYLFLVVLVVQFLSMGSIQFVKTAKYRKIYYAFSVIIAALTLVSVVFTYQGNLMENYVVAGLPTLAVIVTSSIATVASSIVIVVIAAQSYIKRRSLKMLSIIAGVIVVAGAGTLYIASFPELLYYSEFLGTILLWLGFV